MRDRSEDTVEDLAEVKMVLGFRVLNEKDDMDLGRVMEFEIA